MKERIAGFLSEPSSESYQALRQAVIGDPEYRPDSDAFERFAQCLEGQDVTTAQSLVPQLFPSFMLNPNTHAALAYLHRLQGNDKGREFEHYFTYQLQQFLLAGGDGSRTHPYRVSCVDDEYFVIQALQAKVKGLTCQWVDGRLHDVLQTEEGSLYFDVHEVLAAYA